MSEHKNIFQYRRVRIVSIGLLVVIGGYLALCVMGGIHDFNRDTTINGIDVSHMSVQEAASILEKQYEDDTKDLMIQMKAEDKSYQIDLKDNIDLDAYASCEALSKQNKQSFFKRGYRYLLGQNHIVGVNIVDGNALKDSIKKSGILDFNTTVDTTYKVEKAHVVFTKGHDGKVVDLDKTYEQISNALSQYDFKDVLNCELVEHEINDQEMDKMHSLICTGPQNATLDKKNNYQVIDAVDGVEFDLDEAKKAYNHTKEGHEFKVKATFTKAKIDKDDLEKHLFKDTLGTYSTLVNGSSVRKNNVRLAGIRCNGILLPGEEFSFNKKVGQRTVAKGFGAAGAYVDGETVSEVGGGVCQSSSTLYNAVMLSNLEVTLRYPHSFVSSYVPIGRDATVSWGGPDFRFKNNTDYPIKIVMSYNNSRLYAKIVGTNIDGTKVKITSEQLSSTPYTTKEVNDATLEVGKRKVKTSGYNGATAVSYRYVYDRNGQLISKKQEAKSKYKKRDAVILVGTKPVAPVEPVQPTPPPQNEVVPVQ